ncbi:hypothetical protein CAPTEDRAFT_227091 [Capitella teleta]|uniref:Ig-like domain-containing protein n=1 Tax=Capitella teleta TaxID=283909 RepID=R7U3K4_CAPTE|nr:hypothetical protein CAPTEDRAFT_227091 [Capitella teleta]|eukprot:ELU00549.1 hypothetical protein CAPTEDRAFT_227091 [Capitella teleta]
MGAVGIASILMFVGFDIGRLIDWMREASSKDGEEEAPTLVATGKKVVLDDRRYRVFRPHNSALSVLIIRRAKKKDAGIFRCNLSGSSTRHKYMILNVTESKIEARTSPTKQKVRVGKDVTLWCNATGYPKPVVYWTREDRNRRLPDGSYQYWGNGLTVGGASEADTGIYACYMDNFVQPVVSYRFTLMVEDSPWHVDAYKMRFDSSQWYSASSSIPKPVMGKSYLLMCETRGSPKPLPRVRWYRDGKEVRNNRHFYIIEDQPEWRTSYASSTLVIMRFVPRFQGNYTCVASNVFRMKKQTFYMHGYLSQEELDITTGGGAGVGAEKEQKLPLNRLTPGVGGGGGVEDIQTNIISSSKYPLNTGVVFDSTRVTSMRKSNRNRKEEDVEDAEEVGEAQEGYEDEEIEVGTPLGPTDDEDQTEGSADGTLH